MSGKSPDHDGASPPAQHRIATGLVNRDGPAGDDLAAGLRIGPYIVLRELVQAPGARMLEGNDISGQRVILQLAKLRSVIYDNEREERQAYIRMVAGATERLTSDAEFTVHAHGAVDGPDGSRTLFWALPWVDGAERLGRATISQGADLLMAARSLFDRLSTRHANGRLDPILSEHIVVVRGTGGLSIVGAPIHLPIDWLALDASPARLASEEREAGDPTQSGDLWRAGVTLRALAANVTDVPEALQTMIDSLTLEKIEERPASASDVLIELESIDSTLAASRDPVMAAPTVEEPAPPMLTGDDDTPLSENLSAPWTAETIGEEHNLTASKVAAAREAAAKETVQMVKAQDYSSEALTIQPPHTKAGTASERPTKPPGIWTRAKEAQTIRVPYPESSASSPKVETGDLDPPKEALPPSAASTPAQAPADRDAVEFPSVPSAMSIPEAPTLLDAKRVAQRSSEHETKPAPQVPPSMFTKTIVDEPMPELVRAAHAVSTPDASPRQAATAKDPSSEMTIRDLSRADLEAREAASRASDQSEFPTMDEGAQARREPAPPTKRTVWDDKRPSSVNPAAAAAAAAVHPRGPAGTLVAPIGPRGTIVGVRLIDDPTGLRAPDGSPPIPRLLPPGGTLPPGGRFALPAGVPPAGLLPPGSMPDQIPKGATVAGQPALIGTPEALALRARALKPAPSDTGMVPPGGWPAPVPALPAPVPQHPIHPGHAIAPPPGTGDIAPVIEQPAYPQPVVQSPPASISSPEPNPSWAPDPDDDPPPPSPLASKWMVIGAIAFFATGGAAALAASFLLPKNGSPTANLGRAPSDNPAQVKPFVVGPASEVVLEAEPADAKVVAELTGRQLGKTPLRFLVPPGMRVAVLVAAEGYEPQRLVLPERGRISTKLVPLAASEHCRVSITAPKGVGLEGFGGEVETGPRFRIPGAVVLRSDGQGAWLVRCPKFGGEGTQTLNAHPPPREVRLDVSGPWGAQILLSGTSEGKVPVTTQKPIDFYEVVAKDDVGKTTRWLPLIGNTTLKMPKPRKPAVEPTPAPAPEPAPPKKRRRRRRRRR